MSKFFFTKGRGIFVVDLILVPVFIIVVWSGLELHAAGHGDDHATWHNWALVHIAAALLALIFGTFHMKAHWGRCKNLFVSKRGKAGKAGQGSGKKSRITLALTLLFLVETLTGIALIIFVEGGNSGIGLWHYALGLAMAALLAWHIIRRLQPLTKGLRSKKP